MNATFASGYEVHMLFRVVDREDDNKTVTKVDARIIVSPPPFCGDDPATLELHLEHLAKLNFLYILRKKVKDKDPQFSMLQDKDFTIQGTMLAFHHRIE